MEKKVIVAAFDHRGQHAGNQVRMLSEADILRAKAAGFLVKEYTSSNYRPGYYTTRREYINAVGRNL